MKHRIKEFRDILGMSQKKFAEVCGMQQTQITNFEVGRTNPTLVSIEKIAEKFDINPAWLMGWSQNIEANNKPIRVCYVADGPSRLPPYLDTDDNGRVIKWKQTRRPYIGHSWR